MLQILNPNDVNDANLLAKTHQLRYRVFVKELGWKNGITAVNQLEFDCYDHDQAFYLVDVNEHGEIDAAARLTQAVHPNVLLDSFSENITTTCSYRTEDIVEISRFCSDRINAPKNVMGKIIAGLLEIGFHYNLDCFVSFSNLNIARRSERFGWPVEYIGPVVMLDEKRICALKHDVNEASYKRVSDILELSSPILSMEQMERCFIKNLHPVQA